MDRTRPRILRMTLKKQPLIENMDRIAKINGFDRNKANVNTASTKLTSC
jgi:hypothetical protein